MSKISQPLSNVQLELLKLFSYNLETQELLELKDVIAHFFAKKAIEAANKAWENNAWNEEDVEKMLQTKMRKSNNS